MLRIQEIEEKEKEILVSYLKGLIGKLYVSQLESLFFFFYEFVSGEIGRKKNGKEKKWLANFFLFFCVKSKFNFNFF